MSLKRGIVEILEFACSVVDRLPSWTYPLLGRWIGCPRGLGLLSSYLDDRWNTGAWDAWGSE